MDCRVYFRSYGRTLGYSKTPREGFDGKTAIQAFQKLYTRGQIRVLARASLLQLLTVPHRGICLTGSALSLCDFDLVP